MFNWSLYKTPINFFKNKSVYTCCEAVEESLDLRHGRYMKINCIWIILKDFLHVFLYETGHKLLRLFHNLLHAEPGLSPDRSHGRFSCHYHNSYWAVYWGRNAIVFILLPVCLFFPACKENTAKKASAQSIIVYGKIPAEHKKTIKVLKKQIKPVNKTTKALNNGKKKTDVAFIGKQVGLKSVEKQDFYTAEGKVDPFASLISNDHKKASVNSNVQTKPMRILTPLEKFDFSQIKLVAVVTAASGNIAMVEDSTRKGYTIRIGTYIGKNGGKVVKIEKDRVIVRETVNNFKGESVIRSEVLKLNKPDNED